VNMWLKIVYDENDIPNWPNRFNNILVSINLEKIAPVDQEFKSFRISPIFPLNGKDSQIDISNTNIFFYSYPNSFRVLGRLENLGSKSLIDSIFFSIGLASVILISNQKKIVDEFLKIVNEDPVGFEKWETKNSLIKSIKYDIKKAKPIEVDDFRIVDYSILPLTERALIDEFHVSIKLLGVKLASHMPSEISKIKKLIAQINTLIQTLIYLSNPKGKTPDFLSEFSASELKDDRWNSVTRSQILDRIIQVNSALSYVSTQAFSGAIPILERRSLVRRHSLLGIGSAILALNNIARFIENCFLLVPINSVVAKLMAQYPPLKGLDSLPTYDSSEWNKSSIGLISANVNSDEIFFKLPYFNGRLGFRETEFSIAAAIQSITSGASLEWSLMTLTHEMLHGHVRKIITSIFYGTDVLNKNGQRDIFYERFIKKKNKKLDDEKLVDSIRAVIFTYCCFTVEFGSITVQTEHKGTQFTMPVLDKEKLWHILEHENRNISELFVHVLDLHYFYGSKCSIYVPLIWCSWAAIPYTNSDLRHYVLRSLLTIASTVDGKNQKRFNEAVLMLKNLLIKFKDGKLNYQIIKDVIEILNDSETLRTDYFPAFKASMIIVDLVKNVFFSSEIRAAIFQDSSVSWDNSTDEEETLEISFAYLLKKGFSDDVITSPIAYLLDKMVTSLNTNDENIDIEWETAVQFLALNSN